MDFLWIAEYSLLNAVCSDTHVFPSNRFGSDFATKKHFENLSLFVKQVPVSEFPMPHVLFAVFFFSLLIVFQFLSCAARFRELFSEPKVLPHLQENAPP